MSRSLRLLVTCSLLLVFPSIAGILHSASPDPAAVPSTKPQRTFAFTYQVHVPGSTEAKSSHLWIPLPQNDAFQTVSGLKISSDVPHADGRDPQYQNPFVVFTPSAAQAAAGYDVTLQFQATRLEHAVDLQSPAMQAAAAALPAKDPLLQRYLEPDKLVPLQPPSPPPPKQTPRRHPHAAQEGPPHL